MATPTSTSQTVESTASYADHSGLPKTGLIAGVIGAVTLALWFLIVDAIQGRPLFTPAFLGTLLFNSGAGLAVTGGLAITAKAVISFTFVHLLVFVLLGGVAAWLLESTERHPHIGFGILLLFVVFEFGFLAIALLVANQVLQEIHWLKILSGNLLAAAGMFWYFRRHYKHLVIQP